MSIRHRIIFFGSGEFAARSLTVALSNPRLEVVAVVTAPRSPQAHRSQPALVVDIAEQHKLTLLQPPQVIDITTELSNLEATAGLLFAYGQILPSETMRLFPRGIVNIHPSLLPHHRGPSPIEATILNGDTEAGTTLMLIDHKMDAGPILAQERFFIPQNISKSELINKLLNCADKLVREDLISYLDDTSQQGRPQHAWREASYCSLISKSDGDSQLSRETATSLDRKVRAYSGWPAVRITTDAGHTITLHEVKPVVDPADTSTTFIMEDGKLLAQTGLGYIELQHVQLPGKQRITGQDLWNSGLLK